MIGSVTGTASAAIERAKEMIGLGHHETTHSTPAAQKMESKIVKDEGKSVPNASIGKTKVTVTKEQ